MLRGSLALLLFSACNFRTNPLSTVDGSDICQVMPNCDDGIACTTDHFDPATCACTHTPVTALMSGDGCCPSGGTYATDHDCSATCGNGIVEGTETCDTGIASGSGACPTSCDDGMSCTSDTLVSGGTCNAACTHASITQPANGDGCCPMGATGQDDNDCPAAYRITSLTLMDPHTFAGGGIGGGCNDVTSITSNTATYQLTHDSNNDGYYDDSQVIVFRPLSQTGGTTTPASLYFQAQCTTNATTCKPGSIASATLTATSETNGTCLAPVTGSTKPYNPPVTDATGPCFSTGAANMTAEILGVSVSVQAAQIGGTYVSDPATGVMNGLFAAFVTQATADATTVGFGRMSSYFPGGTGNCNMMSDKDTYNSTSGWWVYYNFTATALPWTDP